MKFKLLLTFTVFLAFVSKFANAQYYPNTYRAESDWQINVGLHGLYAITPSKNPGIGGTVSIHYLVEPTITARATAGFKQLNNLYRTAEFKYVPAELGVAAYVLPDWYVSIDAGFAKSNRALKNRVNLWFLATPGIGYSSPTTGLDVSLQYDILHRVNDYVAVFGLKASYSFNLSRY